MYGPWAWNLWGSFWSYVSKLNPWKYITSYWLSINIVSDAIEAAAENDLFKKEQAYDKLRFDDNGEEIIYIPE